MCMSEFSIRTEVQNGEHPLEVEESAGRTSEMSIRSEILHLCSLRSKCIARNDTHSIVLFDSFIQLKLKALLASTSQASIWQSVDVVQSAASSAFWPATM